MKAVRLSPSYRTFYRHLHLEPAAFAAFPVSPCSPKETVGLALEVWVCPEPLGKSYLAGRNKECGRNWRIEYGFRPVRS